MCLWLVGALCMHVCMLSHFSCVRLFVTPRTVACQARILEWVAISSSRGSSLPRDRTHVSSVSCIGRWILLPLSYLGSPCSKYSSMWQRGFTSLRVPISPTIPMIFLLSFMFILVSSEISFPKTLGFCGFN